MAMLSDDILFNSNTIFDVIQQRTDELNKEIDLLISKKILGANPEELADSFDSNYSFKVPIFREDAIHTDVEEIDIVGRSEFHQFGLNPSGTFTVKGTKFTYCIPFEGDSFMFNIRPSRSFINACRGKIVGNELHIIYDEREPDSAKISSKFATDFNRIRESLNNLLSDVMTFNTELRATALNRINKRREKLNNDQDIVVALGYPVKARMNAPETFVFPTKRVKIPLPPILAVPGQALDPTLDMEIYEAILKIIQSMSVAIERAPSAFKNLDEESLRFFFLASLNGHFEGGATAETFNCYGKTDILITVNGRNLFIAECKFWDGPKSLSSAIDQALGYVTWRESKIAILMFSRAKNFSKVVNQLGDVVKGNEHFVSELPFSSETGYRAVMRHKDDADRKLTMTVLAFHVPS